VWRHELSDAQWVLIAGLMPEAGRGGGGRWWDHRQVVNSLMRKLCTDAQWHDLPELRSLVDRPRVPRPLASRGLVRPPPGPVSPPARRGRPHRPRVAVRGQHARAGQPLGRQREGKGRPSEPADYALGLGRGGVSAKIHLVTDSNGLPLAAVLSAGQRHEVPVFPALMDTVHLPQPRGRSRRHPGGRPATRPTTTSPSTPTSEGAASAPSSRSAPAPTPGAGACRSTRLPTGSATRWSRRSAG
jgi:Putative transposase of IS4/5 family (DUF4096)